MSHHVSTNNSIPIYSEASEINKMRFSSMFGPDNLTTENSRFDSMREDASFLTTAGLLGEKGEKMMRNIEKELVRRY